MRDAVRATAEYNIVTRMDKESPDSQLPPPTLPKPSKRRSVQQEPVVDGCQQAVVENGEEDITMNREEPAIVGGEEKSAVNDQEILVANIMEENPERERTETDQPVVSSDNHEVPQPVSQDATPTDAPTDAPSGSTS